MLKSTPPTIPPAHRITGANAHADGIFSSLSAAPRRSSGRAMRPAQADRAAGVSSGDLYNSWEVRSAAEVAGAISAEHIATPASRGECRPRAVMQASRGGARAPARGRMTTCIWCHGPVLIAAARRHEGVCPLCVSENSELGWRTVYDRDKGVGAVPANLRSAYRL
jgi:hypothetical protein